MNIRPITEAENITFDELARLHGTIFNRLDWLALFGGQMHKIGLFSDGGEMVGGVTLYEERHWGMKILRRAPFTPTCGPFLAVKSQNPVAVLEEYRKALECVADYLEKIAPAICMLPLDQQITDALPLFWRGYKVIPQYTYLLDLALPLEQIRKNMSPVRRNDMSKAKRDGLVVRQVQDMGVVRDLVLNSFDRQQKFVDRARLESILFQYANPDNSFACVTYWDEMPITACFIVHDSQTAYYLLGGYRAEDRHHGAGAFAVFEAIRHAQELGLQTFDFEGSVIPPIERFFRGFGGRLVPYFTINKAWWPLEIGLKFFKRGFF